MLIQLRDDYRGHRIEITYGENLYGEMVTTWAIFRLPDWRECEANFTDGDDSVEEIHQMLTERIDNELAEDDPWCEKEESVK